ncbi:MAG: AraC family transcriptional regulator [Scytonematopsis contorta HA4267-MV1]|jgi:AraC family transcriptional regulator|nr:AraC family transcriptional regulator [Scytonematopsis contorta HA4267-MV1]
MQNKKTFSIDFQKSDAIKQILPCAPVLSSHTVGWQGVHLEYHRQPAHDTPDYSFPHNTITIGLGYKAKEFGVNGRIYKDFVPGNIGIIPANYEIKTQAYGNAEFILLAVEPSKMAFTAYESIDIDRLEILPQIFGFDPLIYQIGLELKKELETTGVDSCIYAESMATALAVHLIKRYSAQPQAIKEFTDGLPKYKLREVITHINECLDQNLTLAELAAVIQISPHYFATLFKQSTGLAPHQYVTKCRIEKAKQLLRCKELTILEVSQQVGFVSPSHFAKVFRKYTTTTPKIYRNGL